MIPKKIISIADLSTATAAQLQYKENIDTGECYSVQCVFSGLTGTLDGKVNLQQSLDEVNFVNIQTINPTTSAYEDFEADLNSASNNVILSDPEGFTGYWFKVLVTLNGITGGALDVYLIKI